MDWKKLLESITASVDEELRLRNAYLQAENRMLRQQIHGRMQLMDGDRKALAALGQQLGKKALEEIATIAKPDTILAWHRTLADQKVDTSKPHTRAGRPRIGKEIEDLVVRMAQENRSWGYDRIVGALANLGYRISDQTVGNILKRHGVPPAPVRKTATTWKEFIRIHMAMLGATDFFTSGGWHRCALGISSLCCFLFGGFHHVHAGDMTLHYHRRWMLTSLLRFLATHTSLEGWICVIRTGPLSQLIRCDQGVQRSLLFVSMIDDNQASQSQGMGKVMRMPWVHTRRVRDGPLRRRPRLSKWRQHAPEKAA
jgi:Homeodomain-like domain